jgi:hypothetical protein
MDQQPSSIPVGVGTPRPTEVRLKPASPVAQGRSTAFDPTQIAGGAAYAILLYLITAADSLQQRVPPSAYASWPAPLDHLAAVLFTVYYGIEGSDVPSFAAEDVDELRRYLAERHPTVD